MNAKNQMRKKNQPARFAKIVILLTPFIVAAAGATMYQESKSHGHKITLAAHAPKIEVVTPVAEPWMVGEPFSFADGVNSMALEAASLAAVPAGVSAETQAPTRAQALSAAERQFMLERFDHSVVNRQATAHDSDLPGASVGAY